jgi:hypothetical protein
MTPRLNNILSRLDNTLRWTRIPARVADQMSDAPSADRKHRPLRWVPIRAIAFSCALFILSVTWLPARHLVWLGVIVAVLVSQPALVPVFHVSGPLGKPSWEDDGRDPALRKDAYLFCLGLLAGLNCQPYPQDPVSLAELANRPYCERRNVGLDAECHLVRKEVSG